jgi:hypothetical protein
MDSRSPFLGRVKPQQAIADKLGMERTCFSRARRHGTLPDYALVALMFDPNQPRDWLSSCALLPEMNRAGFIAVAQHVGKIAKADRPGLFVEQMNEFHYEAMCSILRQYPAWFASRIHGDVRSSRLVLADIGKGSGRDTEPYWYSSTRKRQLQRLTQNLSVSPAAAFEHFCKLDDNWTDVFVTTRRFIDKLERRYPDALFTK